MTPDRSCSLSLTPALWADAWPAARKAQLQLGTVILGLCGDVIDTNMPHI